MPHSHSHEVTLGLSFLLGAIHALEPGHGKTAMFLYVAESKRSFWHPITLGLSTAAAHSVSLLAIASAVHLVHHFATSDHHHEEQISVVLQWISAVLVLGIGVWMLRAARSGTHAKCCAGHACDHKPALVQLGGDLSSSPATPAKRTSGLTTTALLGVAVGLLPCPSALAAYFAGLSAGSPSQAYITVILFALGIATSLSLVGWLLQHFSDRLSNHTLHRRLPWPTLRAGGILTIGLFYVARLAWHG